MAFELRMNTKKVSSSGAHVLTHFLPTFGRSIESRIHSTRYSSAFAKPEGIGRSCFVYRRTVKESRMNTNADTSHSIRTCLVTEKSMPAIVGR